MAKNIIQQGLTIEEAEAILAIQHIGSLFVIGNPVGLVRKNLVRKWKKMHDDLSRLSKQINHELKIKTGGVQC